VPSCFFLRADAEGIEPLDHPSEKNFAYTLKYLGEGWVEGYVLFTSFSQFWPDKIQARHQPVALVLVGKSWPLSFARSWKAIYK